MNREECYKQEHDRITNIIEKAKLEGKPQVINRWVSVYYNTLTDECKQIKAVTVVAMPDGTLETCDNSEECKKS